MQLVSNKTFGVSLLQSRFTGLSFAVFLENVVIVGKARFAGTVHTPRFFRIGTHFLLMLLSNNNNHQLQPLGLNSFAVFCVLFDLISIIDANIQKSAL